jgi:hypothetical protein
MKKRLEVLSEVFYVKVCLIFTLRLIIIPSQVVV